MRQVHRCLKQCVLMAKVEAGQGRVELWKVGGGGQAWDLRIVAL